MDRSGDGELGRVGDGEHEIAEQRQQDERDRRPRARRADGGPDVRGLAPRARGAVRALAALLLRRGLGDRDVALDLRRALAQPRAAVRALRDVRADLLPAVLAHHEEIGRARHPASDDRARARRCRTPRSVRSGDSEVAAAEVPAAPAEVPAAEVAAGAAVAAAEVPAAAAPAAEFAAAAEVPAAEVPAAPAPVAAPPPAVVAPGRRVEHRAEQEAAE